MQPQDTADDRKTPTPGGDHGGVSSSNASSTSYSTPPLPSELAPLEDKQVTSTIPTNISSPIPPPTGLEPLASQASSTPPSSKPKLGAQNEGVVAPKLELKRPLPKPPTLQESPKMQDSTKPPVQSKPNLTQPLNPVAAPQLNPSIPGVPAFNSQPSAQAKPSSPQPLAPNVPVSPLNPTGAGLAPIAPTKPEPKVEPVLNPIESIIETQPEIPKIPAAHGSTQKHTERYVEPVLAPDPQKSGADAAALTLNTEVRETPTAPPVIKPDFSPVPPTRIASSRLRVILIIIAAFVILVGGLYGYLAVTKKGNSGNSSTNKNAKSGPVAKVPDGYKLIERDCFSFPMIDNNLAFNDSTSCYVLATFGNNSQGKFNVFPETKSQDNVAKYAELKKQQYNTKVIEQTNIKIDGFDAVKVTENVGSATSEIDVRYYVLTGGKDYQYQGINVTGFEIQAYYNDDDSRKAVDTAIGNWRWK